MKLPQSIDYKHYTSFTDAYNRYQSKQYSDRYGLALIDNYSFLVHGFQSKSCFVGTDLQRLLEIKKHEADYLIGIELEIEGITSRNTSRFSEILQRHLAKSHKVVKDGSLDSTGAEIVTVPLSTIDRVKWYNLLKDLRSIGCTSHNNNRCGLHVHITRSYLKDSQWKYLQSFIFTHKTYFEKLSRRTLFGYCNFHDQGKYTALNLTKDHTCEFRFFRGTLNPLSFLASIDICRSLVEYTKKDQAITWYGFTEYLRGNYPLAYSYFKSKVGESAEISELEVTIPTPRSNRTRRSRRTWNERALSLVGRYSRSNLHVDQERRRLAHISVGEHQGGTRTVLVPVNLSYLPRSIRHEHVRLFGHYIHCIIPDTHEVIGGAYMTYYSAGWGQRSRIYLNIPRSQLITVNNQQGA